MLNSLLLPYIYIKERKPCRRLERQLQHFWVANFSIRSKHSQKSHRWLITFHGNWYLKSTSAPEEVHGDRSISLFPPGSTDHQLWSITSSSFSIFCVGRTMEVKKMSNRFFIWGSERAGCVGHLEGGERLISTTKTTARMRPRSTKVNLEETLQLQTPSFDGSTRRAPPSIGFNLWYWRSRTAPWANDEENSYLSSYSFIDLKFPNEKWLVGVCTCAWATTFPVWVQGWFMLRRAPTMTPRGPPQLLRSLWTALHISAVLISSHLIDWMHSASDLIILSPFLKRIFKLKPPFYCLKQELRILILWCCSKTIEGCARTHTKLVIIQSWPNCVNIVWEKVEDLIVNRGNVHFWILQEDDVAWRRAQPFDPTS